MTSISHLVEHGYASHGFRWDQIGKVLYGAWKATGCLNRTFDRRALFTTAWRYGEMDQLDFEDVCSLWMLTRCR